MSANACHCMPAPSPAAQRALGLALLLTLTFMLVEVVGGWWTGSLALLADAAHMMTDAAALAAAWWAQQLATREADALRTYGWWRATVLAAFVNALGLMLVALVIVHEAWERWQTPAEVQGGPMLLIALAGLVVNLLVLWVLHQGGAGHAHVDGHGHEHGHERDGAAGSGGNINLQAAWLHVLGDLLGSVAAIAAALVIWLTGWTPIDPLLSVLVVLLLLVSAGRLALKTAHVLMEGAPDARWVSQVSQLVSALPGVVDVHHVHAWLLTPDYPLVSLHVRVGAGVDRDALLAQVLSRLRQQLGACHVTVQMEGDECPALAASLLVHAGHEHEHHGR